ncbi:MAG TPA: TIGR01841 family phasin [Paraburkholderia sp.]|jgi:phasin family protein|nr:TIGR01841 family phasin [Paraburkholderia sp.]
MSVSALQPLRTSHQTATAAFIALAQPIIQGVQTVIDLNAQAGKTAIAEGEASLKGALQTTSPLELATRQWGASQQVAANVTSYGRHLLDIVSATQHEWLRAVRACAGDHDLPFKSFSDSFGQDAPIGPAAFIAAINSTVAAVNHAAETAFGISRQSTETAQREAGNTVPADEVVKPVAVKAKNSANA